MPLHRAVSILLTALLVSAAAMTWGAARALPLDPFTRLAALAFATIAAAVALRVNAPLWSLPETRVRAAARAVAGLRNAVLLALVYAWGAVTMIGVYRLSGLRWQHGLQYAAGMALIGLVHALVARALAKPHGALSTPSRLNGLRILTAIECVAAVAGLAFLMSSGKLASAKPDWAANDVFLAGGLAVVALCALAAWTDRHLARADGPNATSADLTRS